MTKKISPEIVRSIQLLRSKGWTVPELSKKFSIGKATASRYIRKVKILPEFEDIWLSKRNGSAKRKERAVKKAARDANKLINNLSDKERILVLSSLYWAEGAKVDSNLTNTDPELIRVFVKGVKRILGIRNDRLRLNIRIYEDMDKEKCIKYWLNVTGLKMENVSSVNVLIGNKIGKLKYGMCRVRVKRGGDMLKYLIAVRNQIISKF